MTAAHGLIGIASVELVSQVPDTGLPIIEILKFGIQLVIGIGTIWKLFRSKKVNSNNDNFQK